MLASLGELDTLDFTAGVGENSALLRTACEAFGLLGLKLDQNKIPIRLKIGILRRLIQPCGCW